MDAADTAARPVRRVLMTVDCVGGVWTYAIELTRALRAVDVHVTLAAMGPPPSASQCREVAALANVTLAARPYRLEWEPDPWTGVAAARDWLLSLAATTRPDVIHLNGFALAAAPWEAPVVVVGHSCVVSWWQAVHRSDPPPDWRRYREEVSRGLHAADLVIAPTASMLAALERHYGPLPRSMVIPNGRSLTIPAGIPKEPLVFSAGRLWDEAKNLRTLCAAADGITWPIYVAGAVVPPGASEPVDLPAGGVTCLGPLSAGRVTTWLSRASLFVLPALYEPFGLSAVEAALAGCALVLGDVDSLREVWDDAAVFVSPRDPSALAAATQSLIVDHAARQRAAERARARAAGMTPARMAASYIDAYAGLRRRAGAAPPPAKAMLEGTA